MGINIPKLNFLTLGDNISNSLITELNEPRTHDAMPIPKTAATQRKRVNESAIRRRTSFADDTKVSLILDSSEVFGSGLKSNQKQSNEYRSSPAKISAGAQTSGLYYKMRLGPPKTTIANSSTTVTDMIKTQRKPQLPKNDITHKVMPKASFGSDGTKDDYKNRMPQPDIDLIEQECAVLTDIEAPDKSVVESLKELMESISTESEPSGSKVLFEAGIFPILMNLIPRSTQSSEIQALSCLLIKTILTSYEPATQPFLDIGGLKYLLDASELSSKALLANKSNKMNTNVLPRMHFDRDDLSYEVKHVEILESFRTVPIKNLSLIKGFYKKYFANGFLNELEEMSSERRKMTFTNFIDIFRKLEHLIKVNNSMKIDGGIYSTIERVLSDSKEIMQVGYVFIYKLDEENQELSQVGLDDAVKMPANVGLVGKCIQLKELLNVQNPGRHTEYFSEIDNPEGGDSTPKSLLIFPILDSDEKRVSGVLLAVNKLGPPPIFAEKNFNEEDEYMFRSLGYIFGAILGNTRVHDSMINTQKKVTVLLDTTRSLASILDLSKLIKVIMDSAKELLSSDRCTLFLHDPERKQLRAIIQGRDNVQEIRFPQNAGIAGAVFISGDPINIHDAYRDSRFNPEVDKQTGYVTRTILCMPIKNIQGECIGVTQMINKRSGVYSLEDEMILSSFSSRAAVEIEKSQLFKKTEDMRIYLQSILSSITSCVITLSESMKLNTINRPWFVNALGIDEGFMKDNPADKWLEEKNPDLMKDIKAVYQSGEPIYVTDFEIKGVTSLIVNYQVMPLLGSSGVVVVLDDISSEKRAVMTLGRYMSPALAKQVMEEGSGQLGGKRMKVSILFSDIRSFTSITEDMDPPAVVELLNHHFTDAVNAIAEEQGILDKFIGDAVMAVFGVPFVNAEDAIHACNSALKMRDAMIQGNRARLEHGKPALAMGIGINTGIVLSGNIGSLKRMEFSCIGDSVNLASRTEGLTKYYGVTILITENTLVDLGDSFVTREIESVVVTGKENSVKVYELIAKNGDQLEYKIQETMRLYAAGLEFYRRQEFSLAIDMFNDAINVSDDGPSKVLMARAKNYLENPPLIGWKADFVAVGK